MGSAAKADAGTTKEGKIVALDATAQDFAEALRIKAKSLGIEKTIYLSTKANVVAKHVGRSVNEFRDGLGYSHPLMHNSYMVWLDPHQKAHEMEETQWHELLHVAFPAQGEAWVEREAKKKGREARGKR